MAMVMRIRSGCDAQLALWRMDEEVSHFSYLGAVYDDVLGTYAHDKRRLEVLCTYATLFEMTGDASLRITHLSSGRPVCTSSATGRQLYISITHTVGWVAIILSESHAVAVDIEYPSDRVRRIASRFLRSDEPFALLPQLQVCWCAKEVAYKYFSALHLGLDEMRVSPFTLSADALSSSVEGLSDTADTRPEKEGIQVLCSGPLQVENLRTRQLLGAHYIISSAFVLVYTAC